MKGISELVGVVLLIAFTIGIGGLVSLFATGLTTTSTGIASNQSDSLTKCAGAYLNLYSIQNKSGASYILYSNPNTQNITSIRLIGDQMTSDVALITYLNPGATASNSTGVNIGTNTTFTIRGLCQSTITVEGTCKQGQSCWQI